MQGRASFELQYARAGMGSLSPIPGRLPCHQSNPYMSRTISTATITEAVSHRFRFTPTSARAAPCLSKNLDESLRPWWLILPLFLMTISAGSCAQKSGLKITVDFMNVILYDLYMAEKHGYVGPVEIR